MDAIIKPSGLFGEVGAISSKSHAHRLLVCTFLAGGDVAAVDCDPCADVAATRACLGTLGKGEGVLDCGESGSTLRFLLPVAAALGAQVSFSGRGRLPERPLAPLLCELERHGVSFSSGSLPLRLSGRLRGGEFSLPGNVSSQFISGLLFALPLLDTDSFVHITGKTESADYIRMTLETLGDFSIRIEKTDDGFYIPAGQRYKMPGELSVQGDWSNAAFFLCAGAVAGDVSVTGLQAHCAQSDRAIAGLLESFGARLSMDSGTLRARSGALSPIEADMSACPDLFPVLAVTACAAHGDSRLYNAARLRMKESDRIEAAACLINSLGGCAQISEDSITVHGSGSLKGGCVRSFNDHRIVMAAAVAACICKSEVKIEGAQAAQKSYPRFFEDYNSIGGLADVINDR